MARRRRKGLVWTGLGLGAIAVAVAVVTVLIGAAAAEDTVGHFARAPVGCTTTVRFDDADRFELYVETDGRFAALDGDCAANGDTYHRGDDDPPRLEVTVVGDDGSRLTLGDPTGDHYDIDGYVGTALASVQVPQAGVYRITVLGDADDVAVAVGRDPLGDALLWWLGGFGLAGVVGLTGLVLFVIGLVGRAPSPEPSPAAAHTAFTMGTDVSGYTPVGGTLPPPPPPPPPPGWYPDATEAGTTLPPPPPPPH